MVEPPFNDNDVARAGDGQRPDSHGQAAMLLVESLIHALIAKSVLTVEEAMEILEVAIDVGDAIEMETDSAKNSAVQSRTILEAIGNSLSLDLPYTEKEESD